MLPLLHRGGCATAVVVRLAPLPPYTLLGTHRERPSLPARARELGCLVQNVGFRAWVLGASISVRSLSLVLEVEGQFLRFVVVNRISSHIAHAVNTCVHNVRHSTPLCFQLPVQVLSCGSSRRPRAAIWPEFCVSSATMPMLDALTLIVEVTRAPSISTPRQL